MSTTTEVAAGHVTNAGVHVDAVGPANGQIEPTSEFLPDEATGKGGPTTLRLKRLATHPTELPTRDVDFVESEGSKNVGPPRSSLDEKVLQWKLSDDTRLHGIPPISGDVQRQSFFTRLKDNSGKRSSHPGGAASDAASSEEHTNAFERFLEKKFAHPHQDTENDLLTARRKLGGNVDNFDLTRPLQEGRKPRTASNPHFRRLASFGPSYNERKDRPKTLESPKSSGNRWKTIRAGLRLLGTRKEKEGREDKQKSAELLGELSAGSPAAIMLASMFQRDEKGRRRVPVLLEQVKLHLSQRTEGSRSTANFTIELEYGNSATRMKWEVHREYRDFFNLHSRYRLAELQHPLGRGQLRLPKFPKDSIPYLRSVRGLGADSELDEFGRPIDRRPSQSNLQDSGLENAAAALENEEEALDSIGMNGLSKREGFAWQQKQKLETYLRGLISLLVRNNRV